jgi:replication factor C large subunit
MTETWVEKYRPKNFAEFKGQGKAIEQIKLFFQNFMNKQNSRRKKAILLYGPAGVGKTTLAHVIANETNSEIFELNASDLRNKSNLQEVLQPVIQQQSLVKGKKIILIDEADGISGYYDRGGIQELLRLLEISTYPVIITANDAFSKKLSSLRKKVEMVQIEKINSEVIIDVLMDILRKENLFLNYNVLHGIAARAQGDVRGAINDLQSIVRTRDPTLLEFPEREKEIDIFNALKKIFKDKPQKEMLGLYDSVKMPLDEILLWIEENIPKEYHGKALFKAYQALSKADLFKGRIYKQQYWRFLVYQNIFTSYAIAVAREVPNKNFVKYNRPERILKIWLNNQRQAKQKSIAQKYAKFVHVGQKRAMREFPIIKQIIKSNIKIQEELKLNEEEIEYLMNF